MSSLKPFIVKHLTTLAALALLVVAMGGTWQTAAAAPNSSVLTPKPTILPMPGDDFDRPAAKKSSHKDLAGKLNLNTATEDQLMLLPTVGPSKAERIVTWRKKNGGFKRAADLRRVKGFGYKTWKRLEPYLDIAGDTTLAVK